MNNGKIRVFMHTYPIIRTPVDMLIMNVISFFDDAFNESSNFSSEQKFGLKKIWNKKGNIFYSIYF